MNKIQDNRAWFLVLPVALIVAFSAIIPLMTVVNYSLQDIIGPDLKVFVGLEWFRKVLHNTELQGAFIRQIGFSASVLLIEVPLGLFLALCMPSKGKLASLSLLVVAIPLLIPWNVVGTIWQLLCRTDIGPLGVAATALGISYNYASSPLDAWVTVLAMDVWHWTPLICLLCYAGLQSIPPAFYQAASIDGASRWAVFRYIEAPRLQNVMVIGVLLRFMDSFMIYTEPFVLTGGGPGNSTTFLSQFLTRLAIGQFDLGPAAAFSIIYYLVILFFCFVFYTAVMNRK